MAYISKMTSIKEVLIKIDRTFKPQGSSWIKDAIEDTGWCIQAIGYHMGFEKWSTPFPYLTVANHRVKIPCNVERIIAIEQLIPRDTTGLNILNPDGTTPPPTSQSDCNTNYQSCRLRLGSDLTGYGLVDDESPRTTRVQPNIPYYNVNPDYIITSFSDGIIKLHCIAFTVDKNGYPKIVDDADYKMCVEWYLFSQMLLKGYKNPQIDFKGAFQMYEMYRLRAENAGKVMSLDGAQRFNATWSRYIQNSNVENDFFMNNEQTVYISE